MANADVKLDPAALTLTDAAKLLSGAAGQQVPVEMLEADVAAGAPTNADGTINLMRYAAWLVQQASGDRPQASGTYEAGAHGSWSPGPEARSPRPGGSHAD